MEPAPQHRPPVVGDEVYRQFIARLDYLPPSDVARIEAAYAYAEQAHAHQKRMSGEPYITHPVAVASLLAVSLFCLHCALLMPRGQCV